MTDFFTRPAGLSVSEIADLTGAKPRDGAKLDGIVSGVAALDRARPTDLAFMDSAKYVDSLSRTSAGVCLTTERFAERAPTGTAVLLTAEPFRDFVAVARK